jgi:hypothetical protein
VNQCTGSSVIQKQKKTAHSGGLFISISFEFIRTTVA